MSNKELAKAFKLTAQLMELHDENPFKIRSIQNAAFKLERHPVPIEKLSVDEIGSIGGKNGGKEFQAKISDLLARSSFPEMDEMLEQTPKGVIEMYVNQRYWTQKYRYGKNWVLNQQASYFMLAMKTGLLS